MKKIDKHLTLFFLKSMILFNLGFFSILLIADFTENLRKYASYSNFNFLSIFGISLYKLPDLLIQTSPFITLFSSLYTFRTLIIRKEIDVLKSSGLSIWQILKPFIIFTLAWGIFLIMVISPISTLLITQQELTEKDIKEESNITYSKENVWILDMVNKNEHNIIMAKVLINQDNMILLREPSFFKIINNKASQMASAKSAIIQGRNLKLIDVIFKNDTSNFAEKIEEMDIPISIKSNRINNIASTPNKFFVWQLPLFILSLKKINLEYQSYSIYFFDLITLPISLVSMILISMAFSLQSNRKGGSLYIIFFTLITGFGVYFLTNFLNAFGISGAIPPALAVISGKLIVLLFSLNLIYKKEGL